MTEKIKKSIRDEVYIHSNNAKEAMRESVALLKTSKIKVEQAKSLYIPYYFKRVGAVIGLLASIGILIIWAGNNVLYSLNQFFLDTAENFEVDIIEIMPVFELNKIRPFAPVTFALFLIAFSLFFSCYLINEYDRYNRVKSLLRRIISINEMCDCLQKKELSVDAQRKQVADTLSLGQELTWGKKSEQICYIEDIRQNDIILSLQKTRTLDRFIRKTYLVCGFLMLLAVTNYIGSFISRFIEVAWDISYPGLQPIVTVIISIFCLAIFLLLYNNKKSSKGKNTKTVHKPKRIIQAGGYSYGPLSTPKKSVKNNSAFESPVSFWALTLTITILAHLIINSLFGENIVKEVFGNVSGSGIDYVANNIAIYLGYWGFMISGIIGTFVYNTKLSDDGKYNGYKFYHYLLSMFFSLIGSLAYLLLIGILQVIIWILIVVAVIAIIGAFFSSA